MPVNISLALVRDHKQTSDLLTLPAANRRRESACVESEQLRPTGVAAGTSASLQRHDGLLPSRARGRPWRQPAGRLE